MVDEGALGDSIWNYKGDTYAPDYDLALWDFMGYIDPGDSAACFTTDQIENYNEMNWSNAEYDRLTLAQYREMDSAKRMELLKQAQAVMYAEQPMIVIDYPSVLQAVNTSRWEGWQPYVQRQRVEQLPRPAELHRPQAQGRPRPLRPTAAGRT